MKFRKKPVVIEAWQWCGAPTLDMPLWVADSSVIDDGNLYIETMEGNMKATPCDWIILGVKGEVYPCKPDIFEATYEPVE